MKITVFCVRAFTFDGAGGNPAGVVLNAEKLSDARKQKVAALAGFPETAFVEDDAECDVAVRFFTPTAEVDFCGHATVGAFTLLHQQGLLDRGTHTQKTKAGKLTVDIEPDGSVVMTQAPPKKLGTLEPHEVAPLLQLEAKAITSTHMPIEIVSTGLSDAIIPVARGMLDSIRPDFKAISAFCQKHHLIGFHVFELCEPENTITASCRNFAPLYGIPEEAATGSSCGALAYYLSTHISPAPTRYIFEQGRSMGSLSKITASVTGSAPNITVQVGGAGAVMEARTFTI